MLSPTPESVAELIQFVRANSPFYKKLYVHLPENTSDITSLPILESDLYWEACSVENNQVLTGPLVDAGIFSSGGTTAKPKVVYLGRDELHRGSQMLAAGLSSRAGVVPGDRIANLTRSGICTVVLPFKRSR
jgi:phenylacetate-CoA ligase